MATGTIKKVNSKPLSTTITARTDGNGTAALGLAVANYIPVCAYCSGHIVDVWQSGDGTYKASVMNANRQIVTNTNLTFTVFYYEV